MKKLSHWRKQMKWKKFKEYKLGYKNLQPAINILYCLQHTFLQNCKLLSYTSVSTQQRIPKICSPLSSFLVPLPPGMKAKSYTGKNEAKRVKVIKILFNWIINISTWHTCCLLSEECKSVPSILRHCVLERQLSSPQNNFICIDLLKKCNFPAYSYCNTYCCFLNLIM